MNISHISDTQLVRHTLKRLPWMTLSLTLVSLGLLVLTETDSSQAVFAFELSGTHLKTKLAFDTTAPFKSFGFPLFTSFFVHDNPRHLFANLPWLLLAGSALQINFSSRSVVPLLVLGHLTALIGAMAAHHWLSAPPLVLGMSGGVFALLFAWLFGRSKFWSWTLLMAAGSALLFTKMALFLSHAPALAVGSLWGVLYFRKRLKR